MGVGRSGWHGSCAGMAVAFHAKDSRDGYRSHTSRWSSIIRSRTEWFKYRPSHPARNQPLRPTSGGARS